MYLTREHISSWPRLVINSMKIFILISFSITIGGISLAAKQKAAPIPKLLPINLLDSYSEGTDVDIFCMLALKLDDDATNFYWSKDGVRMDNTPDGGNNYKIETTLDRRQSILRLSKLMVNDAGNYTCVAENTHGSDSTLTNLIVSVELSWISEPKDVKSAIGQRLSLRCLARGQPKPTITWTKVSGPGHADTTPNKSHISPSYIGEDLEIKSTTLEHSGWYECKASNGLDQELRKVIKLDIQGAPKLIPISVAESYNEGSNVGLFCALSSGGLTERIQYSWLKNGRKLVKNSDNDDRLSIDGSNQEHTILKLSKITSQDTGNYTCIAENSHGSDSTHANLVVSVELSWIEEPNDVHIGLGEKLSVRCSARGQPQPTIKWTKLNGQTKGRSNQTFILGSNLDIDVTTLEHSGLYECRASNGLEQDLSKVIEISIQGKLKY